jgi:hypothetical protein
MAWGLALMKGYASLDEWINDWVSESLRMYAEGRADIEMERVDYGLNQVAKER